VPIPWLPKVRLEGKTVSVGTAPVPDKVTVCGLPLALSVMVRVPLAVPAAVGVNVTLIVQFAPAPMLVPHVFVWEKPLLATMLVKVSEAVPESVTVTVCAALVAPTA
jgi:hypothetical protein